MHDLNIIHKDVKYDNFRVHCDQVKIIDFGLTTEFIVNGKHLA
jgi:serine/threonine protein kinase